MTLTKWHKIILSFLIIGIIGLVMHIDIFSHQSKLGPYFTLSIYLFFAWIIFAIGGIIMFILRKFKILKDKENFVYIFIGACNITNAAYSCYLLSLGYTRLVVPNFWFLVAATACLAFLIFVDVLL